MGDFYQNGIVTTLHNLAGRPVEAMEAELLEFSRQRPMGLLLPSLYSELEGEALPHIVEDLCQVPYLSQIVIGLDAKIGMFQRPECFTPFQGARRGTASP